MKKKNGQKKNQKVKYEQSIKDKSQNRNMNYLIFSNNELENIQTNISRRLEKICLKINDPGNPQNIKSDQVVKELEQVQRQAKNHDFLELQKRIVVSLGKRILFLQLQNKKIQLQKKKTKKQQIQQSFFRNKKIKKFDYQNLTKQKLKQNSYIVRPYSSGKGFIESEFFYKQCQQIHLQRLQQCQYLKVIRQVNKIYMDNYSLCSQQKDKSFFKYFQLINVVYVLCVVLLGIGILMLATDEVPYLEYMLLADLIFLMIILSAIGIKTFINKPNNYNQLEQTKEDIIQYFQNINRKNKKMGKKYEWICHQSFMYLQVHFNNQ